MSASNVTPQGGDVTPPDAGAEAPTIGRLPGPLAWIANRLGMEELMEDQYNRIVPIHARVKVTGPTSTSPPLTFAL